MVPREVLVQFVTFVVSVFSIVFSENDIGDDFELPFALLVSL